MILPKTAETICHHNTHRSVSLSPLEEPSSREAAKSRETSCAAMAFPPTPRGSPAKQSQCTTAETQ